MVPFATVVATVVARVDATPVPVMAVADDLIEVSD